MNGRRLHLIPQQSDPTIVYIWSQLDVLGVLFDSKLNWQPQVSNSITKAKKTLHAIKLIRKYFTRKELNQLITSNFYSVLYYNCEIWLTPNLNPRSKKQLLSTLAKALKLCETWTDPMMSYEKLHEIHNRAIPMKMMKYRLALQLYKLYNTDDFNEGWLDLNFQQNFNGRNNYVQIMDCS